ncbi:tripartite motif-containing protein 2-like [Asterias rubens]|uniref:tripartite motif-containing protein 2-like n=1 Tax=Asterias rubens TaxID=7604 RepID=UPI001454EB26|nr:tripartite motif-containing protein 2-like [Asterias rubens]
MAFSKPAQVSALEKIRKDYLECSICQEEYTEPKLLDCLHSLCKYCLLEYHTTNYKDAKMLICPLCRRETQLPETGVEDFKSNFILTGLAGQLEQVSSLEHSKLVCNLCDEKNNATHFCYDCPMFICANCYKMHKKIPSLLSHTVATLKDVRDGKTAMKKTKPKRHPECQTHEGEVMRFYCATCGVMICRDCTVIDHCKPQHEYIDCNQASSIYKQSLAQLFNPLEETMKKLKQSQATASTMKDNLNIAVKRTMADVKNRADEIRAEVTAQERRIMDEIQTILKDRNKKLEEFEQAVSVNLQQIKHSLQTAKDVSKNSSVPDFLASYPTISTDLMGLIDQNQPKIDSTLDHLRFNPGVCDISLGSLIMKEPKWELSLECGEGTNVTWGIDASVPGDEMAVADLCNKRVAIYDTKGHQKKSIPLSSCPQAVAAFQNQLVIVDGTNSVKMYNRNGNKMFEFHTVPHSEVGKTSVDLWSVAVIKDTIMVGDWNRSVITKHRSSDGSLIDTVSVQTKPWFLAIDSKDRVVISGKGKQVDIVGVNGTTLFSINPKINSQQVTSCRGVCCDSSAIYIAVWNGVVGNCHIHQYDTRGRFISCIAQGLYSPCGISLTSDGQQLAVADWTSVKIYNKV